MELKIRENPPAIHQLVNEAYDEVQALVQQKLNSTDMTATQKWLVYGRIISLLFQMHYKVANKQANLTEEIVGKMGVENVRP